MRALMQDVPLLVPSILRHAAEYHGDTPVIARLPDGGLHRGTYAATWARAGRLAAALRELGLADGDRVGTLAWNGHRHLELYYATAGSGLVCHTINPRLFPDQIAYIINHAADRVLCVDPGLLPLLEALADRLPPLRAIIVLTDAAGLPASPLPLVAYEDLIAAAPDGFAWPDLDERDACGLCYSSGTTGEPKGALYSHRSTVLHAMAIAQPDVFAIGAASVVMPVVPMFHVNAWGLPYAAPMVGAALVLPGVRLDGASLHGLIVEEGVTFSAGVPTVWMALLDWAAANGRDFGPLRRLGVGGSACPPVLAARFRAAGVDVVHAWGMTETSPVGLANAPKAGGGTPAALDPKQGRPLFGMRVRIVDPDGAPVPRDGAAFGSMQVRGPWVAAAYYGTDAPAAEWFDTGDVATMDAEGYVQLVDRTKDVIKSGGEWISSIDLENIAVAHPAVQEAAAVARPDARWGERPLLVVVPRPGMSLDRAAMVEHYAGRVARWCIPDDVLIVESLPHTATGKLLKSRIRELYCAGPGAPETAA